MNVTRFNQAPEYVASNHFDMQCLRLQGREAGPAEQLWMGMSILRPGGHTSLSASLTEKHYVVLQGELTLASELNGVETREVLRTWDSCCFAPGEKRQIINHTTQEARILLAIPFLPPVT
jgi:quercetin dioxygenase-like cupin family protein